MAAFASAREALRAAVNLQAAVQRSGVTPGFPGVGVGLDSGEAIAIGDDYRGTALNLAARLCSLAGPGEVLASETVTNLARKLEGLHYVDLDCGRRECNVRVAYCIAKSILRIALQNRFYECF